MKSFLIGKLAWGYSPIKVRRSLLCSPLLIGVLKFNMDGPLRENLGPERVSGVLCKSKGNVLLLFLKSVSACDSNKTEVLTILEALHCLQEILLVPLL